MALSLLDIRRILHPQRQQTSGGTLKIIDTWTEYAEGKSTDERPLEYLCYEMESIDPHTGERHHYYKAIKLARVIRIPKGMKQSTALMDMQTQVMTAIYEQEYNFICVIANVREPVPLGLLFLYGVQGVSSSLDGAKENCRRAFIGLSACLQGTYRVLEMRVINAQETEWLREKLYGMKYTSVVRGIPKASRTGEDAGNKGMGGANLNPDSQGTLEELITGMADYEYVIEILTTPVHQSALRDWAAVNRRQMTRWQEQLQGTKGFNMSLSIPMMYGANQGSSVGQNKGYTVAESYNVSQGTNVSQSFGENVGQALSQSYGQSFGKAYGQSFSESISQTHTVSQGVTMGRTVGMSFGVSQGQSVGQNISQSQSVSQGSSQNISMGRSFGESVGQSQGVSQSQNMGQSFGTSRGVSSGFSQGQSVGQSFGQSVGQSVGQSIGQSRGQSVGMSQGESAGVSQGFSRGYSQGQSVGQSIGQSFGQSANMGRSVSSGQSYGVSQSEGRSQGYSMSEGRSVGESFGTSQNAGQSIGSSLNVSHGTGSNQSFSENVSQGTSQNVGSSYGTNQGQSVGASHSIGSSENQGISSNQSAGVSTNAGRSSSENVGMSQNAGVSESENVSRGTNVGTSHGFSSSEGATGGSSWNDSIGSNKGSNTGHSTNMSGGASIKVLNMSSGASDSQGTSTGTSNSHSSGGSAGWSNSSGETSGISMGDSAGYSYGQGKSLGTGYSQGQSASYNESAGMSYNESMGRSESIGRSESYGANYGKSSSESYGINQSSGTSHSVSRGHSEGISSSFSQSEGYSTGYNVSQGTSYGQNIGQSQSSGMTTGQSQSMGQNWGQSSGESMSQSYGESVGQSYGQNYGMSESQSASQNVGQSYSQNIGQSYSENAGMSYSQNAGQSYSQNAGQSMSQNVGQSYGQNLGQSEGSSYGVSQGQTSGVSYGQNSGMSESHGSGTSIGQSLGVSKGFSVSTNYGTSQTKSESQSYSVSQSESWSTAHGYTKGESYTESESESISKGETSSYGQSKGISQGQSSSTGRGTSQSQNIGYSTGLTQGASASMGIAPSLGYSKSYQWLDQQVKDIVEMLDYKNERIKNALRGNGAFYSYVYIACPSMDALSAAKMLAKSTWQNEEAMINPLQVLDLNDSEQQNILTHCMGFSAEVSMEDPDYFDDYRYCTVLLPKEMVSYTHLPRVSEGGLFVEVGDVPKFSVPSMLKGEIYMGTILSAERYTMQNGYETPFQYRIDEREMMHMYFTGSSRSGKTVTAMRFIAELTRVRRKSTGKRFRIVCMDPKQDWRALARYVEPERFRFYNMGNTLFRPLHLNPLKIPHGVIPQMWIDGVIDCFCRASGLLERGKQILGETIYQLYHEAGVFGYTNKQREELFIRYKDEYFRETSTFASDSDALQKATDYANDRIERENTEIKKNQNHELISNLSSVVTFVRVYERMNLIKLSMEGDKDAEEQYTKVSGQRPKGKSGNDTKDAYARILDRIQAFNREFSVERQLFGGEDGMSVDELIGADDVTVIESKGLENTFRNFIFGVITSGFYKFALAHEGGFLAEDQYETLLVIEEANEVLTGSDVAGTGGGASFGMSGQSEFEQILDQSAGYGLFICAITQKISEMPRSIIANAGLIFAGRLKIPDDITTVVRSIAREERYEDRELVKWFPRSPTGWFICMSSRTYDIKDSEPVLVKIAPLNTKAPTNAEIDELLTNRKFANILGS